MSKFQPTKYQPPLAALWAIERMPALGPGSPNESVRPALGALTVETAFPVVKDREAALACISGTWLYHDFLDESHRISQDLPSWFGSYWHGIMHRREPDAENAKYWFRRVGANPVFETLVAETAFFRLTEPGGQWNPFLFVDACEARRGTGSVEERFLCRLQRAEMWLLFDWCYQKAVGA